MEAVRKVVDASLLMSVIQLPETLKNRKLEVIVFPAEQESETVKTDVRIDETVDSLIGAIPDIGMSLSEYREERREKYALAD